MSDILLQVEELRTYFNTPDGLARAVDGVSFNLEKGKTLAIVGESGCGKSMTALSILQLVPEPAGYIDGGKVLFEGADLLDNTWDQMRAVRGKDITMIFQEPMSSLNPTRTIGWQLVEAMEIHGAAYGQKARGLAADSLGRVGLDDPSMLLRQYPHELSGGMRQRVMIAMALSNKPKLLIADEPTTALDVTVQAQILALIRRLQREEGMTVLLITHDLGIVAEVSDNVAVMYAGQIVESAETKTLFNDPKHPYTQGLFASIPRRDRRGRDLSTLEGIVPPATDWPGGCRFSPRCGKSWETCFQQAPDTYSVDKTRYARCHLYNPNVKPKDEPKRAKRSSKKENVE
jgi:oligopeptide/dipeptide ABC transporter ATP-binding protein